MANEQELFEQVKKRWLPLAELEASALLTSTTAKITFDETGITVRLWFPWVRQPAAREGE